NATSDSPYSPVVRLNDTLYVSGHVPVDPQTRQVAGHDIATQTRLTLDNLKASLALAGASFADVVKTTVFLTDIADFAEMNKAYRAYFPEDPPARTTIGVAALANPAMRVEIEMIAAAPKAS
ncbi:MAG TPA: RidA family protein, partial [Thermomicrobiales bacterium]|nr:RidA family protein [Thermomicrobiales bacterium]